LAPTFDVKLDNFICVWLWCWSSQVGVFWAYAETAGREVCLQSKLFVIWAFAETESLRNMGLLNTRFFH